MKQVGTIRALYRYPVKSMRGESLDRAEFYYYGVDGDRRYAFVKTESLSGFPWLTARDLPHFLTYTPRFEQPDDPLHSKVIVAGPDGAEYPLDSPDLLSHVSEGYRRPVHLTRLHKGCHDAMPVSLLSSASVAALGESVGEPELDFRRFRPNIYIDLTEPIPYAEESWLGQRLTLGEGDDAPALRLNRQNVRCAVTTFDPDTIERNPQVLKTIVKERDEKLGIYASVERPGWVAVGAAVYLDT